MWSRHGARKRKLKLTDEDDEGEPPQSNGYIERFHRTLLDEHLRIMGRTKRYESLEENQKDLDVNLASYNRKRTHRRRGMEGRTPYQVFKTGLQKAKQAAKTRTAGKRGSRQRKPDSGEG